MGKINIFNIADYILIVFQNNLNNITPMKLQKLLYYVKVWSLVANQPLIKEDFFKWEYGPVNKNIYGKYKFLNAKPIPIPNKILEFPKELKILINFIVENYIELDAITLSQLTHSEEPWLKTPKNNVIPESSIKAYYSKLPFAKNFPLMKNKPFFPILTQMNYAFIFDFKNAEYDLKSGHYYFKNYDAYKKQKNKIKKQLRSIFG